MDEVKKATPPATEKDWESVCDWAKVGDRFAPCLLELRRRVEALEAGGGVAGNPGYAPAAPAGVSVDELADCLPANAWAGPEGYSRQAFARHLLDHPRIGPLLRGKGAGAPKRVVLADMPLVPALTAHAPTGPMSDVYWGACYRAWDVARAEVERQQQGGQVDG